MSQDSLYRNGKAGVHIVKNTENTIHVYLLVIPIKGQSYK